MTEAFLIATAIFEKATPILKIHGLNEPRWRRDVEKGARIGPWLQASYTVLDEKKWQSKGACLYLVRGSDGRIRYVGISRNGVKHRWRLSPALDALTLQPQAKRQLFHSQCWKHLEAEYKTSPLMQYEVRFIEGDALRSLIARMQGPLVGFLALGNDDEGLVAGVERWLCNNKSNDLVSWNSAMTRKK
ncbi:hypothetical protein [Diaphorobacter sp.]|uniref:hypothetical protein n=1 Tax=Diaphorobacter sp. TaxID=1934310 RepID=UPI0028ABB417|nr:hypothetical protein [Diaphorobacter sp.]